jgi:hypothetical protein
MLYLSIACVLVALIAWHSFRQYLLYLTPMKVDPNEELTLELQVIRNDISTLNSKVSALGLSRGLTPSKGS